MDHPSIARIFDGGTTEPGRPFFVMELVKGRRSPVLRRAPLDARERLDLFVPVCQAVQHAHQKGSFTATSSHRTSWWPRTTASRSPK